MSVAAARPGLLARLGFIAHDVVAGLVASLVPLANCFSFAALLFRGLGPSMLNQGVAVLLASGAVTTIVVALTGSFRVAVAGPIAVTSALLAAMLGRLAPDLVGQSPGAAAATALAALGLATLATGLALLALGGLRLGRMVRFTPFPVIAGFIGATGWVMIDGAVGMATGVPLSAAALPRLADPRTGGLLAGLVGLTIVLLLTRRLRHPLQVPLVLGAATIAIDWGLHLFGVSFAEARSAGLLFDVAGPAVPSIPLLSGALLDADWGAVLRVAPGFAPVVVIGVVQVLVTAASLEVVLDTEIDLDRELRSQGLANLASALAGGIVGFVSSNYTTANIAAHGRGRLSVFVVGAVMVAALAGGTGLISVVPRIVLGGMLLANGLGLFWQWGIASRRRMAWHEWLLTLAMMAIAIAFGFLPALLAGLVGSCVLLAVSLSRVGIIRRSYGVNEGASALERSEAEMQVLLERGAQARVVELGGFLFFGSAHQLLRHVRAELQPGAANTLVLDFSAVIGLDSSAASVLARIRALAGKASARLIVSGVRPGMAAALAELARPPVLLRATLDEAIEAAEDGVLAQLGPAPAVAAQAWLAEALGDAALARLLTVRLEFTGREPGDVLCRQGEAADTLYFVASGRVSVMAAAAGGPGIRLRVFGPQTIAGELGFFLGAVRSATMQVEQAALVGQLSRSAFQELSASHPALVVALLEYLARVQAERLSFATGQIVMLRR